MEQIAFDMGNLLMHTFPELAGEAGRLRGPGLVKKMAIGGQILHESYGGSAPLRALDHPSDTVRGWGVMAIGADTSLDLRESFELVIPFADDLHFAVREWAWLALRRRVLAAPLVTLDILRTWPELPSPRLRRFASEVTRPRGVWSPHIPLLKTEPEHGSDLLGMLRSDPSTYVQDSVGNWLNDAGKTRPDWVTETCSAWLAGKPTPATERICRKALRRIARS